MVIKQLKGRRYFVNRHKKVKNAKDSMQKKIAAFFFILSLQLQVVNAQTNSTFATASKLVGIAKQIKQSDSITQVLLKHSDFSLLLAVANFNNIDTLLSFDKSIDFNALNIDNLILRYNNAHSILEYLAYAAQNKTIVKNKLVEKSLLAPYQNNIALLIKDDVNITTLVQAMNDIEAELARLPIEYSVKTNAPNPPTKSKPVVLNSANNPENNSQTSNLLPTANMGIPSQSALILGAADFLAERFKTELAMHYLDRMKDNFDKSELKYLFPSTRTLLNYNTIANQQQLGTLLRTAFDQDLRNISSNFMTSLTQPDGFAKYVQKDTSLSRVIRYAQGTTRIFKEVNKGTAPLEVLSTVAQEFNTPESQDFDKIIGLVNLFTKNFVVETPSGKKWIDESYLKNNDTLKYAIALIALQNIPLMKSVLPQKTANSATEKLAKTKQICKEYSAKMRSLLVNLKRVEQTIQQHYTYTKRDTIKSTNIHYEQYIALMNDLVQLGSTFIDDKRLQRPLKIYNVVSEKILQTYQANEARQYGVVLNNLVYTLDYLLPDSTKTEAYKNALSQIVLYGSFMIDVSNAKNDKQIKAILDNYAMPVGSYSVKRRSEINVGVQAYVGGFGGFETIVAPQIPSNESTKTSIAFNAPIGIDLAFGNKKEGSLSAFISVVDLGAIVSFRLQDPLTRDLPELKLENIIAPGFHLFYGLPKTPISLGAGVQMAPSLRQYTATNTTINADYAIRYGVTAAVDIPIFSFYNKAGKSFYRRVK